MVFISAHALWTLERRPELKAATPKGTLSSGLGGCRRKDLERDCWYIHPVATAMLKALLSSVDSEFKERLHDTLHHIVQF